MAIMATMEETHAMLLTVNIAQLKNRLSAYLDLVRRGEEIIVRDRSRPIAKIIPLSSTADYEEEERALIASGQLRPGSGRADPAFWASFWTAPAPHIPARRAAKAVREDRDED
jgi:prevent-host-death family protein